MTVDVRIFTADELLGLPDDGSRYELVEGELKPMSPAGYEHGLIVNRINARLFAFAEQHRVGQVPASETGFVVARNPDTVLSPGSVRAARLAHREMVHLAETASPGPETTNEVAILRTLTGDAVIATVFRLSKYGYRYRLLRARPCRPLAGVRRHRAQERR